MEAKIRDSLKFILLTLLTVATIAACGYRFAGSGSLPGGAQTIFVDVLGNRTAETGIENTFTADLRYEFVRNRMSARRDEADGILSGEVRSLRTETITRQSQTVSLERRVSATLTLKLEDKEGRTLWSVKGISDSEAYSVTANDRTGIDLNKREAIARLSRKLAESVFHSLTADF
jgi:hypothetical protein